MPVLIRVSRSSDMEHASFMEDKSAYSDLHSVSHREAHEYAQHILLT